MSMHEVIANALAPGEFFYAFYELPNVVDQFVLVVRSERAGREMYHPGIIPKRLDLGRVGILKARENVHALAPHAKLAAQFSNIYVHPTRLAATQHPFGASQRASMHAYDCYSTHEIFL